jgi:hypothetical protein
MHLSISSRMKFKCYQQLKMIWLNNHNIISLQMILWMQFRHIEVESNRCQGLPQCNEVIRLSDDNELEEQPNMISNAIESLNCKDCSTFRKFRNQIGWNFEDSRFFVLIWAIIFVFANQCNRMVHSVEYIHSLESIYENTFHIAK